MALKQQGRKDSMRKGFFIILLPLLISYPIYAEVFKTSWIITMSSYIGNNVDIVSDFSLWTQLEKDEDGETPLYKESKANGGLFGWGANTVSEALFVNDKGVIKSAHWWLHSGNSGKIRDEFDTILRSLKNNIGEPDRLVYRGQRSRLDMDSGKEHTLLDF
jgi:hypothetical protein